MSKVQKSGADESRQSAESRLFGMTRDECFVMSTILNYALSNETEAKTYLEFARAYLNLTTSAKMAAHTGSPMEANSCRVQAKVYYSTLKTLAGKIPRKYIIEKVFSSLENNSDYAEVLKYIREIPTERPLAAGISDEEVARLEKAAQADKPQQQLHPINFQITQEYLEEAEDFANRGLTDKR